MPFKSIASGCCSVGIMAYNEEANIGQLIKAILEEEFKTYKLLELIVVASGCTDRTEEIVREWERKNPLVKLITQEKREGKASAINLFLQYAQGEVIILISADTIPQKGALEKLLKPLWEEDIGMTGGRPVPVNEPNNFMGFCVCFLWLLHHRIAMKSPKMGEAIAFKNAFLKIPISSSVDEANIEPLIRGQGFKLRYVPDAVIHNKGPTDVSDFLRQRRRIFAGHLALKKEQGYIVSTMNIWRIISVLLPIIPLNPVKLSWLLGLIFLEAYGRFLGFWDYYMKGKKHSIWEVSKTTKQLNFRQEL